MPPSTTEKDKSKVHKLSLKGSAKLVAEFVCLVVLMSIRRYLGGAIGCQDKLANTMPFSAVPIFHPYYPVCIIG
jgi:hypothetical protein